MSHFSFALPRRAILLRFFATCCLLSTIPMLATADEEKPNGDAQISVIFDYGDGVRKQVTVAWKEKMTVFHGLEAAARHSRGIKFQSRGKGETLFITSIDDCENEGSGRNWTYRVNDKAATKSCGIAELLAGDVVLWRFGSSR